MRNIFSMSIWAPNAIPSDEWKYRNLKRVMFPVIDVIFILSGLSAAYYGVPAISEFYHRGVVDSFALAMSLSGFAALLGVAFPKLWALEIGAKSVLLGLMVVYFTSLFILTRIGEGNRGFVLGIAAVAIAPVIWRLSLLGNEWQQRRVAKKIELESKESPNV